MAAKKKTSAKKKAAAPKPKPAPTPAPEPKVEAPKTNPIPTPEAALDAVLKQLGTTNPGDVSGFRQVIEDGRYLVHFLTAAGSNGCCDMGPVAKG